MTLNVRRVWDLYSSGMKPRRIAKQLGLTIGCVTNRLSRAKGELHLYTRDVEDREAAAMPRCRCGLLLPCHSCVPSAVAFLRAGDRTYPPGAPDGR